MKLNFPAPSGPRLGASPNDQPTLLIPGLETGLMDAKSLDAKPGSPWIPCMGRTLSGLGPPEFGQSLKVGSGLVTLNNHGEN
jgi:hypothetical protein